MYNLKEGSRKREKKKCSQKGEEGERERERE
jgi:hypothetical protein